MKTRHAVLTMNVVLCLPLVVVLLGCFGEGGGSREKKPAERAFDDANSKITSNNDGAFYGNTSAAKEMSQQFSERMGTLQKEFFEGGKKKRGFSLTDEQFVTYCQANKDSVLFLVHVPQFKKYKDDVRDSLLELAWSTASEQVAERYPDQQVELCIGLRGSLLYGGSATGTLGGRPAYENKFSVDSEQFHKYFEPEKKPETEGTSKPEEEAKPDTKAEPANSP